MADIDPDFLDEQVATLDDRLSELLAEIEAACMTWAVDLADRVERFPKREES